MIWFARNQATYTMIDYFQDFVFMAHFRKKFDVLPCQEHGATDMTIDKYFNIIHKSTYFSSLANI